MKAISLWQPWASAIALGVKRYETRSWITYYRGPIAIHAAKTCRRDTKDFFNLMMCRGDFEEKFRSAKLFSFSMLPKGAIVAVADLVDVLPTRTVKQNGCFTELELEYRLGDYTDGRFAWKFENVRPLAQPYGIRGHQGFFEVPDMNQYLQTK